MTDNIQKLYETAGVDYEERYNNCTLNKEAECRFKRSCDICKYAEEIYIYPTFTAEKQLELIKWLSQNTYRNYFTVHYHFNEKYWRCKCNLCESCGTNDFENALASVVLALWQDLTDDQKQEIKRILE